MNDNQSADRIRFNKAYKWLMKKVIDQIVPPAVKRRLWQAWLSHGKPADEETFMDDRSYFVETEDAVVLTVWRDVPARLELVGEKEGGQ